jgi:arylsulfatase
MIDASLRRKKGGVRALALALVLLAGAAGCARDRGDRPDNVILVVSDSLRAQNLSFYGYDRATAPFLDSLVSRALVYEHAYSHYSYTWPTISNLFTGLPFSELNRRKLFKTPKRKRGGGLDGKNRTLAEILREAGVKSRGVSANAWICDEYGFGQGFDAFHDATSWNPRYWKKPGYKFPAEQVNEVALAYLDELAGEEEPWFLYLHYYDTHMPYQAPQEDRRLFEDPSYRRAGRVVGGSALKPGPAWAPLKFRTPELEHWFDSRDVAQLIALYDAEIHHFDRAMAELFAALEDEGVADETTVIVTSDHGEAFYERGFWGHGFRSRDEEEHVPLLVVHGGAVAGHGRRIAEPATTSDLFPSLLQHFRVKDAPPAVVPQTMDVLSGAPAHPVAYTEGRGDARILRDRRYSLYRYYQIEQQPFPFVLANGEYLFDRERDPGERVDLLAGGSEEARAVRARLVAESPPVMHQPMYGPLDPMYAGDAEIRRRLEALGYVE